MDTVYPSASTSSAASKRALGIKTRAISRAGHNEGMSAKYTIDHMQLIAWKRDGECLSTTYKGNKSALIWRCAKDHTWHAKSNAIMSGKTWCPHCAQKARRPIAYLRALATQQGGECIDTIAHGMQNDHHWRCSVGHEFAMTPNNVKYGHWCGQCWRERR